MNPSSFIDGELVLCYDVAKEALGPEKFETLWKGPYIIKKCLLKGAYILTKPNKTCLSNPVNGLYLKKLYP